MLHSLTGLLTFCQLLAVAYCAELKVQITANQILSNPSTLPASTHATLTSSSGAPLTALLRKDNTLVFPDIQTTGTHLLQIYSQDYVFAPYRIDLSSSKDGAIEIASAFETYPGTRWTDHGVALIPASSAVSTYTLYPKVLGRKNFYESRPSFNVLSLLKNPMIMLGGVALLITFGMPKMLENMDPEMRAEYEEMQKKGPMSNVAKAMSGQGVGGGSGAGGFDLASYLAGSQSANQGKSSGREVAADLRERRK